MSNLKVTIFDENMAVRKSKYLVILYLYKLTQPSDPLILGGPLILLPLHCAAAWQICWKVFWIDKKLQHSLGPSIGLHPFQ